MMTRPMAEYELSDPASYASPALEADLVMKGGITSGLIYPLTACRLATRYRFRSVGGASAGAIAAALTAAAEYQRRHPHPAAKGIVSNAGAGFARLTTIPDVLGTKLETLFVPADNLKRPFQALTIWLEPEWGKARKLFASLGLVVAGAPLVFTLVTLALLIPGLLVALGLLGWQASGADWGKVLTSVLVWLPVAVVVAVLVTVIRLVLGTLRRLAGNGYGFCNGLAEPGSVNADPPLTEWLTDWLDEVAGLSAGEGPLTFGQLYGEQASEVFRRLRLDEAVAPDSPLARREFDPEIDLQMMTTCLTFKRPYIFPFRTKVFCYCPDCWAQFFPVRVLDALVARSAPTEPRTQQVHGVSVPIDQNCIHHRSTPVLQLPSAPDIPVVIGVRLSLSFPILLSAIPFQTIDYNRGEGKRGLVELWFSDGGISSNFPIHFFDRLLPTRPTFGINLTDQHPDFPDRLVHRAKDNRSGLLPRATPITSVVGFLGAVVKTMQNWVDDQALPAPGFRDRVVAVRTKEGEGGLNLKMDQETIKALGARGDEAALELEDFDFDNHRWVRYRTAMNALSETLDEMLVVYPSYDQFITSWTGAAYPLGSAAARAADHAATATLMDTVAAWQTAGYPASKGRQPHPRPELRPRMRQ